MESRGFFEQGQQFVHIFAPAGIRRAQVGHALQCGEINAHFPIVITVSDQTFQLGNHESEQMQELLAAAGKGPGPLAVDAQSSAAGHGASHEGADIRLALLLIIT